MTCRHSLVELSRSLILGASLLAAAAAYGQTTELVSVDSFGNQADDDSAGASVSDDGRYVAFQSQGTNLVPGTPNFWDDVFLRDRQTGTTQLISIGTSGDPANSASVGPSISGDGRYVAFTSGATNLGGVADADIYVRDWQAGVTELISQVIPSDGEEAYSNSPSISKDGRFVAFVSNASNLVPGDTNGLPDVFVYDRQTGITELRSIGPGGIPANAQCESSSGAISEDGRWVTFNSSATNLVPGVTNALFQPFVHDRQTGIIELASVSSSGAQANATASYGSISPDGRYVGFNSYATNLVPGDTNGFNDVFVRDRQLGITLRASVSSYGAEAETNCFSGPVSNHFVAFKSGASNLVPFDSNGATDVFVHDLQTGVTELLSVSSSGVQAMGHSAPSSMSSDGRYVTFSSDASNLVAGDTNGKTDVFLRDRCCSAADCWLALGSGVGEGVSHLDVLDDGTGPALYVVSGPNAATIETWNGSSLETLQGWPDPVHDLAVFDDGSGTALYVGGDFATAGGVVVNNIARLDGSTWSALGSGIVGVAGVSPAVGVLTLFDDGTGEALYAAGRFTSAGGVAANSIAKWDGTNWSALGSGVSASVFDLAVFDDGSGSALYACGNFQQAGGVTMSRIAKWDGSSWSALGSGLSGAARALTVFDDGNGAALYAGGNFTIAGGLSVFRVAKWDGASWSALGSGMNDMVLALQGFDDGNGPALYAAGEFTMAGGFAARYIAKWNGSSWSALGNGVSSEVNALAVFDDGGSPALYAGGDFTLSSAGDSYLAKWDCKATTTFCTAGISASGCQALLSASGSASATAPSGFTLSASTVEGQKDGLFFFGTNGQQANPWGNGTSYQCVVPPVVRTPTTTGVGTIGLCDGSFAQDLNALWCPSCPKPAKNPGAGATVQAQLWYRDPASTSNQTTSLSDAIEFGVGL